MTTLQNSSEQASNLEWRAMNLEVTKWCLEKYRQTKDEFDYEQAKIFGEWSAKIKKEYIDKLK